MITLTARGALANNYIEQFPAQVVSSRELSHQDFNDAVLKSKTIINNAASIQLNSLKDYTVANFDSTRNLVDTLVADTSPTHLIQISSMSILSPTDSSQYVAVKDMTHYAYSKYLAETYVMQSNLSNFSIVRFSTLFYADPTRDGLSKLIHDAVKEGQVTIYDNGAARRNFIPLEIANQYLNKLAEKSPHSTAIYNFAAPSSTSFMDVVEIIKKHIPNLKINNIPTNSNTPVLYDFDIQTTTDLGLIDFSLETYIANYIKVLNK
ncbi:MAG: NAD(P)-dependent oxidoreductase [Candidatus Microsaccharimonas sp.]